MSKTASQKKSKVDTGDSPTYWLKPEQIDAMRTATVTNSAHYLADRNDALLALMADTGLRVAETAGLDEAMIDFEDELLSIPPRIQKGYIKPENREGSYAGPDPVSFALKSDTLRTLRKYLNGSWRSSKDTPALFPARSSDRISPQGIRNLVSKAAEDAEIRPQSIEGKGTHENVTPHTLRHSVAYRMVRREGHGIYDVRNRLRHADVSTTEAYYSHFDTV